VWLPQFFDHTCDPVRVRTAYRCWYVTFTAEAAAPVPLKQTGHAIGVDLGVTDFAATSDGDKIANPRHLERKARRLARYRLVVIDRWYPSSKTCSACGHRLADLSLSTRHWRCPSCGTRHDRDINAAQNILAAGLAVARGSPGDACGADVRHSGPSRVRSATKQEPRPARTGIPVLEGRE
jgi:transposase